MHDRLKSVLVDIANPVIAVSGGVDSLTLAMVASSIKNVVMMHAVSPAVPPEATARVRRFGDLYGWNLYIIEAGEFDDADYRSNPVNRCFYCKTNLYASMRSRTRGQLLSGANVDDLGEYRPGLDAARAQAVRHPYIEAGVTKQTVRRIARDLGLEEIATLPSSPCLSSRVETGIRIEPAMLSFIHGVERLVVAEIAPATVRCRVRAAAVVVELDKAALDALTPQEANRLDALIRRQRHRPMQLPILFEAYRNGSAFLVGH